MAYDKEKIFEKALKAIQENKVVVFMKQVITRLPISEATFYLMFPKGSEQLESLKEALEDNKTNMKEYMMGNWVNPDASASLQISLFKLIADESQLSRLNNTPQQGKDEKPTIKIENYIPLPKDGSNDGN